MPAKFLLLAVLAMGLLGSQALSAVPVILDTDIGDDIDDTWAMTMLLKSPQFDLRLVTTTFGKAEYRARIIAKLLTVAGRTDVPVALGAGGRAGTGKQQPWIDDFKLADYKGKIHEDGVSALIQTIKQSQQPVTIIAIGPLTTLAAALDKDPSIASNANLVGMQGSVRLGYDNSPRPVAEYNVKMDIPAARKVLSAPWRGIAITPLDTCGLIRLSGQRYQSLAQSDDAMVKALMENYRIWKNAPNAAGIKSSSVLFDTVAVYLADPQGQPLVEMEDLNIAVSDKGLMTIDPAGAKMRVASKWKDLDGYRDHLIKTLLGRP